MYEIAIKELNAFLKGQYMGIHAYDYMIHHTSDPFMKHTLQKIQQDHKAHAMRIAERIQNLGGVPVTSEGIVGAIEGSIYNFFMSEEPDDLLRAALKGEDYYGIQLSSEMVKGDLDPHSQQIVDEVLRQNEKHVQILRLLLKEE